MLIAGQNPKPLQSIDDQIQELKAQLARLQGRKDNSGKLFDNLIRMNKLKNDSALASLLKVAPPMVSKIRNGREQVRASMILYIHENLNLPVWKIRELIAAK